MLGFDPATGVPAVGVLVAHNPVYPDVYDPYACGQYEQRYKESRQYHQPPYEASGRRVSTAAMQCECLRLIKAGFLIAAQSLMTSMAECFSPQPPATLYSLSFRPPARALAVQDGP